MRMSYLISHSITVALSREAALSSSLVKENALESFVYNSRTTSFKMRKTAASRHHLFQIVLKMDLFSKFGSVLSAI